MIGGSLGETRLFELRAKHTRTGVAARVCVFAALLSWMASAAVAQSYRGEATMAPASADPVELTRFRFLTFAWGREGPMDMPLGAPPVAGREYFIEADVFGIESVGNIRFELVDAAGRRLQSLTMWKASDGAGDGEFYGFVTVPNQAFRAVVLGANRSGGAFRSLFQPLFQPAPNGPAAEPPLPAGLPPGTQTQVQNMIAAYQQQLRQRAAQAAAENADGVIRLARAMVSKIVYEPLYSMSGSPIGLRLHYSLRFSSRQTIVAVPHVFPVYQPAGWRGVVGMKIVGGAISPAPVAAGAQSLQDVLIYGAAATYEPGATYEFTVDMAPDYVIRGEQTGRFCIYSQRISNRAAWDAIMASPAAVPYSVSISDTETSATIPEFLPQRAFYDSFLKDGAFDCGPTSNSRF